MKYVVAGTAGHIDHGKTALVRALTGIDTDRLKEEKQRGISIDLGFAHLDLAPDVRLALIDVPGHERFIRNMLAGAQGIDLALLVIAADDFIKPQTREHFQICRLLGIARGIVVLTKSDLVAADWLELAKLEAEEFVRGSFLENAPVVAVSSVTGAGLGELRARLLEAARASPGKDAARAFRLPVDRAFSMRGFGTVATGTLISGSVAVEQEVELHPGGRRLRVRGIQTHGAPATEARAGQRTALNLAGIETEDLRRGMTLTAPGRFRETKQLDCMLELLAGAKPLKHRAPVHFHSGTAEVEAEVRRIGATSPIEPGSRAPVRLALREPMVLSPGDRFIVRMFSPVATIGGGVVLDIAPPTRTTAARLRVLDEGGAAERIALLVSESKAGLDMATLAARTGLREEEIERAAVALAVVREPQFHAMDPAWLRARQQAVLARLREFHRTKPLLPGMPKEEMRSRELPEAPPFVLDFLAARTPEIAVEGETVRLRSHQVALESGEEEAAARIEAAFAKGGLSVPATAEVLAASGLDAAKAKALLQLLLRQRRLIRIGDGLVFHPNAVASLRQMLAQRKGARFEVGEFKEWTGVSRKYAIPLLEFLDRERITRREGAVRLIL